MDDLLNAIPQIGLKEVIANLWAIPIGITVMALFIKDQYDQKNSAWRKHLRNRK